MKLKKKAAITMALVLSITFMSSFMAKAAYSYITTYSWSEGWLFKDYYAANIYEDTSNWYRVFLKNISGTTYWDQRASSATISVTSTVSVAEQDTSQLAVKGGLKFPYKGVDISGEVGYTKTWSTTYTVSNSVTHTRTLDRTSPVGYYSLQSTVDADKYRADVSKYDGSSYVYNSSLSGYFFSPRTQNPYVYLRYTTYSH